MLYSTSFYQYGIKVCDFVVNTGKDWSGTLSGAKRSVMWSVTLPSEVTALDCQRTLRKSILMFFRKSLKMP